MQPSLPNEVVHPCSRQDRGGCEHVCIVSYNADGSPLALCRCRAGFRLEGKGKCISALLPKFLIFANAYHGVVRGVNIKAEDENEEVLVSIGRLGMEQVKCSRSSPAKFSKYKLCTACALHEHLMSAACAAAFLNPPTAQTEWASMRP